MAYEDLFKDPYWRAFKRKYEIEHGGKLDLNTGKIIPNNTTGQGFTLGSSGKLEYTGPNFKLGGDTPLRPGYSKVQFYPSTTVLNRSLPSVPFDFMKNAKSSGSTLGKVLGSTSKILGPVAGIGTGFADVLFGNNPTSKALSTAGVVAMTNPGTGFLAPILFGGAGLNNYLNRPEWQINKSNRDFAKYEAQFGTPDNPNLGNLAPALKPLTEDEIAMLQFKANAQQAQREQTYTPQAVAPTPEQYQEAANKITSDVVSAQNQLTEMANSLQPQPVKYNSAVYGENIYNPSPGLSAMTENRIDQMNNAIQNAPNLFNNLYGQGNVDVGSNALAQYAQMLAKQQQDKQALAEQMLAGYQEAAKKDRYQQLMNDIVQAGKEADYRSSLVFIPSGFNPNGGQTFTPYHLTNAPQQAEAPSNVDRYMNELKLRQALAPDNSVQNQAMEKALQAQALGEATGYNPMIFMGNENLSKEMMGQVIGQQVKDASNTRAALAKLTPETYQKLSEIYGKGRVDAEIARMNGEYDIAQKNIEQSAMTDRANAEQQNKFFTEYMGKMIELAKQGISDNTALEKLKLSGMNDLQLAQLKADLESSDPVKQLNAAAQYMNGITRFVTPQEAETYQNKIFPQGLPQFTRRSP